MQRLILLIYALMLVACAGTISPEAAGGATLNNDRSINRESANDTVAPAPDEAPRSATAITDIIIPGAGGLSLAATFYPSAAPGPRPGVILLHMLNSRRSVWADFAAELNNAGYSALAVDMRGHGETGSSQDWNLAEADLQLVWEYLTNRPDIDPTRTAFIGGSIGANMSLRAAANEASVATAVLLSAGLNYRGVTTEDALTTYGDRPVFIIASRDDLAAARAAETLFDQITNGASQLHLYDTAGHGTNMFGAAPDLSARIIEWLATIIPPPP